MKKKILLLPLSCAALIAGLSLTSCNSDSVKLSYQNAEGKEESLTIKATTDSAEITKALNAIDYSSFLSKQTMDLTKISASLSYSANGSGKQTDDGATRDTSMSYSLNANAKLELANTAESVNDIVKNTNLSGHFDESASGMIQISGSSESSDNKKAEESESINANIYKDGLKLYADVTHYLKEDGESETKSQKGYIPLDEVSSSDLETALTYYPTWDKTKTFSENYSSVYQDLQVFKISKMLDIDEDETTYNSLDDFLNSVQPGLTCEQLVKLLNLEISEVENNEITFKLNYVNSSTDISYPYSVTYDISLTVSTKTFLPTKLLVTSYTSNSVNVSLPTSISTSFIRYCDYVSQTLEVNLNFGSVSVDKLSDYSDYQYELAK